MKPSKIKVLKDGIDEVIYSNIQNMVDPNCNGAKAAQKEEMVKKQNPDYERELIFGKKKKSNLPKIKQKEPVEPFKTIHFNYKEKNVENIAFKAKYGINARHFQNEMERTQNESKS